MSRHDTDLNSYYNFQTGSAYDKYVYMDLCCVFQRNMLLYRSCQTLKEDCTKPIYGFKGLGMQHISRQDIFFMVEQFVSEVVHRVETHK